MPVPFAEHEDGRLYLDHQTSFLPLFDANGKVIVAVLNGELIVRRFHKNFSSAFLIPENNRFKAINLAEFTDFALWGVVTYAIHPM